MNKALLKEERKHGDPSYPVSIYHITSPPEEPLLDLHWHDELEFLLVTEGQAVFRVEMVDYAVRAGEAIFVNSSELHSGYVVGDAPCSFAAVVFHADLLGKGMIDRLRDQYILPLLQRNVRPPVHLQLAETNHAELLTLLTKLFDLNRQRELGYELSTKGLLYLAIVQLLQAAEPVQHDQRLEAGQFRTDRLKAAVEYIEQHYQEPIQLRELADLVSMSESYFCRFFKRITTKSPIEYINHYRVQQAAAMLRHSDKKVMDIALDVGFNNLSYFNVVFKHRFGCTPASYRKRETRVL
jgi:AraC-like DNA-binding protein